MHPMWQNDLSQVLPYHANSCVGKFLSHPYLHNKFIVNRGTTFSSGTVADLGAPRCATSTHPQSKIFLKFCISKIVWWHPYGGQRSLPRGILDPSSGECDIFQRSAKPKLEDTNPLLYQNWAKGGGSWVESLSMWFPALIRIDQTLEWSIFFMETLISIHKNQSIACDNKGHFPVNTYNALTSC